MFVSLHLHMNDKYTNIEVSSHMKKCVILLICVKKKNLCWESLKSPQAQGHQPVQWTSV